MIEMKKRFTARALCPPDEEAGGRKPAPTAAGRRARRLLIGILLLLILLWSGWSIHSILENQWMQRSAELWRGSASQRYCQVSAFWNSGELDAEQAGRIVLELEQRLQEETDPVPIAAVYGGMQAGQAAYGRRTAEAEIWYVTEDFFRLHSFALTEGGTGTFQAGSQTAVLNEQAAWRLFGSAHGCGESIVIRGQGYRVTAVLQEPKDSVNRATYGSAARIYLPMTESAPVTFLEAVLPEYYSGYAAAALSSAAGTSVKTNTGRFRLSLLWKQAKAFFSSPPESQPQLPPWELAAKLAGRRLCVLWSILFVDAGVCLLLTGKTAYRLAIRYCASRKAAEKKRPRRLGRRRGADTYALLALDQNS